MIQCLHQIGYMQNKLYVSEIRVFTGKFPGRLNVFKKMEPEGVSNENLRSIIVKMRETVYSANTGNPIERKSASYTPFSSLSLPVEANEKPSQIPHPL
jgi:hypothetical protein